MKEEGIPVYEQQHAIYNHRNFRYYIDDEKYNELKRFEVKKDDLIVSCSGTIGKTSLIQENDEKGIISQALLILRVNQELINPKFLKYFLETSKGYNSLISTSGGSSQVNIAKKQIILDIPIAIPSLLEQAKIIKFLDNIKIELLEKTLCLYQKHNQYIKNNYFDNLKTENIVKFKDIIEKGKAGGTPKSTNKNYYDGEIPFLSINDMTTQGKYITTTEKSITNDGLNNSSAWIIPKNSLLYSIYASIGFVSINKIDLSTSQAIYGIILKENINNNFIYHYLKNFKRYIHRYIETGTQGNLNSKIVQNIEIKLPSLEEQNFYTNLFDNLDKQIEIKEKEISILKDFKKGLLQKMFI